MAQAKFKFVSDAKNGDQFNVVGFSGHEAISTLYHYEIEIRAPLAAAIDLDDVLDHPVRFIIDLDGQQYPCYGILSSLDELQTAQGYVHYRAVLAPRLWSLSIYKTNEIYTREKTVDRIVQTVLENAGFVEGVDFDLGGLDKSRLLKRDYVCQFGESDFDFISRLLENEGIFYYFEHANGAAEKIIFINDMNYQEISKPGLIFDVAAQANRQHDCIDAWTCRKQRLPAGVTVRDFNPDQPSLDISDTMQIDHMGQGTEYIYGCNLLDSNEASYLSEIRAEEQRCTKTRYYAEGSVTRLQAGYLFGLSLHPNSKYNGVEYLVTEVNHAGQSLDLNMPGDASGSGAPKPQYRNNFVAIAASEQYRPARKTVKPRFYGTMTAFVFAEASSGIAAEVDDQGRYRVHLPFDRADGSKDSDDPDRKASTWIRMAQPYAGENEGMSFPLKGGTEVLLTFINGDPDQPIISAALPNASMPSLLDHDNAHVATVKTSGGVVNVSGAGSYTNRGIPVGDITDRASASALDNYRAMGAPEGDGQGKYSGHFMPPADFGTPLGSDPLLSDYVTFNISFFGINVNFDRSKFPFVKCNDFGQANNPPQFITRDEENIGVDAHIDRSTGPMYVHRVGSTFAYPQQERVYFCGTFHEDFHMDDLGIIGKKRVRDNNWLMTTAVEDKVKPTYGSDGMLTGDPQGLEPEVFHFPEPGKDGAQIYVDEKGQRYFTADELAQRFPPNRVRGVSEDKRWGDQMTYAWGRVFNWAGGPEMGDGGSQGVFNYGNSYTENLLTEMGLTSLHPDFPYTDINDNWNYTPEGTPSVPFNVAHTMAPIAIGITALVAGPVGIALGVVKGAWLAGSHYIHEDKNDLTTTWELNPGSTSVEKTFGHSFSYQMGLAIDIHEGNSISKTYGSSSEWTEGNSESYTGGDSVSTTIGNTSDAFLGSKYEFNLGTSDGMTIGLNTDTFLGGQVNNFLGVKADFELSATTGINAAKDTRTDLFEDKTAAKKIQTSLDDLNSSLKMTKLSLTALRTSTREEFKTVKMDINSLKLDMKVANLCIDSIFVKIC